DFDDGQATFGAPVFNVRDMNPNTLLADPSTAPLAALGKATSDAERLDIFEAALKMIRTVADQDTAIGLAGMASALVGVRLSSVKVEEHWRRIMAFDLNDSSVIRDARAKTARAAVFKVINYRFNNDPQAGEIADRLVAEDPDTAVDRVLAAESIEVLIA
ncbi:hypothetical protein, partial [Actinoplanes sp. NBRC 101535]|uniref:hypothetical protein n=2 Tax=Actinoplanes TaxID=1865 RepID=UPI002553CA7C